MAIGNSKWDTVNDDDNSVEEAQAQENEESRNDTAPTEDAAKEKTVAIKVSNLKKQHVVASKEQKRVEAIDLLVKIYKKKHGKRFFIHPVIQFVASLEGGIKVIAKEKVEAGTPLLRLPEQEQISIANLSTLSREFESTFSKIVGAAYRLKSEAVIVGDIVLHQCYSEAEVKLFLIVMRGLHLSANAFKESNAKETVPSQVVKTWPSYKELKQSCAVWDLRPQVAALLRGTATWGQLELKQKF
ncbi:unknown protein [Seminavis robusta]|uniref:Uncharacterized protein n=1 Tax=Seminavis robusta TaxID=568900 RepID=A0A9N8H436_9STRA|nr:unknown protein [Seminavis robusta]|eukprot:Sro52_g031090.1 n/a (243) ;mRNA; f:95731-96648